MLGLVLKRSFVWLVEILAEVVLLALFILIWYPPGASGFVPAFGVAVYWIIRIAVITAYILTTLVSRLVWKRQQALWYPLVAATLYIIHAQIFYEIAGGLEISDRFLLLTAGTCIVFVCTFVGSYVLRGWERRASKETGESPAFPAVKTN